jgi:hypothetical protein
MYRKRLLKIFLHMAHQAVENSPYRFMGLTRRIGEILLSLRPLSLTFRYVPGPSSPIFVPVPGRQKSLLNSLLTPLVCFGKQGAEVSSQPEGLPAQKEVPS